MNLFYPLPSIAEESSFIEAASLLADPAMEGFLSSKMEQAASPKNLVKLQIELIASVDRWEHEIYSTINEVAKNLFKLNAKRVASLNSDREKLKDELKRAKKMARDRGLPEEQRQQAAHDYEEKLNRYEELLDLINSLKSSIFMTGESFSYFNEKLQQAISGMGILHASFLKYKDSIEMMSKMENLRFGVGNTHEKYLKELTLYRDQYQYGGDIWEKLRDTKKAVMDQYDPSKLAIANEESPTNVKVDKALIDQILLFYQRYRKEMQFIKNRLSDMRRESVNLEKGKLSKYEAGDIILEVSFLIPYLTCYSEMMNCYLSPILSIIKAN